MRSWMMVLISWVFLAAACVQRPPPIKTPPGGAPAQSAPECTVANGMDERGNPSCSDGCKWDAVQKQCVRVPDI
jgi:hypothetical protein